MLRHQLRSLLGSNGQTCSSKKNRTGTAISFFATLSPLVAIGNSIDVQQTERMWRDQKTANPLRHREAYCDQYWPEKRKRKRQFDLSSSPIGDSDWRANEGVVHSHSSQFPSAAAAPNEALSSSVGLQNSIEVQQTERVWRDKETVNPFRDLEAYCDQHWTARNREKDPQANQALANLQQTRRRLDREIMKNARSGQLSGSTQSQEDAQPSRKNIRTEDTNATKDLDLSEAAEVVDSFDFSLLPSPGTSAQVQEAAQSPQEDIGIEDTYALDLSEAAEVVDSFDFSLLPSPWSLTNLRATHKFRNRHILAGEVKKKYSGPYWRSATVEDAESYRGEALTTERSSDDIAAVSTKPEQLALCVPYRFSYAKGQNEKALVYFGPGQESRSPAMLRFCCPYAMCGAIIKGNRGRNGISKHIMSCRNMICDGRGRNCGSLIDLLGNEDLENPDNEDLENPGTICKDGDTLGPLGPLACCDLLRNVVDENRIKKAKVLSETKKHFFRCHPCIARVVTLELARLDAATGGRESRSYVALFLPHVDQMALLDAAWYWRGKQDDLGWEHVFKAFDCLSHQGQLRPCGVDCQTGEIWTIEKFSEDGEPAKIGRKVTDLLPAEYRRRPD